MCRGGVATQPLPLVRLRVADGELLERPIRHTQRSRFFFGAFDIPMINHKPLDKPHRGTVATRTVNERRLAAFCGDRVQKLVNRRGIRRGVIERDVVVANAGGFRSSGLCFDVRAGLAGLPEINDRCEAHLLDFGYCLGIGRTSAGDRGVEAIEIRDALNRFALAHLHAAGIRWLPDLPCVSAASVRELTVLQRQMETRFNCVQTSSMGRLFDAVASLIGICQFVSYEAQAAIELEMRAESQPVEGYQFALSEGSEIGMDSSPVLRSIVSELLGGIPPAVISARFHTAVADCVVSVCSRLQRETGIHRIALTGGVFQNVLLLQLTKARLLQADFEVLTHRIVPPNDGGLALGQAVIGAKD
jgi:hypothetical protein